MPLLANMGTRLSFFSKKGSYDAIISQNYNRD